MLVGTRDKELFHYDYGEILPVRTGAIALRHNVLVGTRDQELFHYDRGEIRLVRI